MELQYQEYSIYYYNNRERGRVSYLTMGRCYNTNLYNDLYNDLQA